VANLILLFALNFMLTLMDFSNKTPRAEIETLFDSAN